MSNTPIILQIQQDCLDNSTPITSTLRKAKVAASKLELITFLDWINNELNGYKNAENLPEYRDLTGGVETQNIHTGEWIPLIATDKTTSDLITRAPILETLGTLEDLIKNKEHPNTGLILPYSPHIKSILATAFKNDGDYRRTLSSGNILGILESVRNIVLDWTLELEKSGTLGEGMSFKKEEKKQAQIVTQIFYADHIGFAGNVSDQASVTSNQSISEIDMEKLTVLLHEIQKSSGNLPEEIRTKVEEQTKELLAEAQKPNPKKNIVNKGLNSLGNICEKATANLTAQGIVSMIKDLL